MDEASVIPILIFGSFLMYNIVNLYFHKKIYKSFKNIPDLQLPLEGMFVRIEGEVFSEDTSITPISEITCAFYQLLVKASYSVKRESPGKGYKTVLKTIDSEYSKKRVLIHKEPHIFMEIEKDAILEIQTETERRIIPIDGYPDHPKATEYYYEEKYLEEGDQIVVFGRLVKEEDTYILKHTYSKKLPFIVYLDSDTALKKSYLKNIMINLFFIAISLAALSSIY